MVGPSPPSTPENGRYITDSDKNLLESRRGVTFLVFNVTPNF